MPPLLYNGVSIDVYQHAVLLEYAVMLPCVLPVDLSLVHAVTSYTGVYAVVINRVICGCFCAGTAKIKSGVIISIAKNNAAERKFRPFLEFSIL